MKTTFILIALILMTISCKKQNLTPTEILIGKWNLVSIQGSDTIWNVNRTIKRATTFSYNHNPLIITYDSTTTHGVIKYNLLYQLEFQNDGVLLITEEYSTLENISIFSMLRTDSWHKDPFAIDPYTYYLYTTSDYVPYSPNNSKIFLRFMAPIKFTGDDITNHQLKLQSVDDHLNVTYNFEKL
jgi:hypothetical protein